MSEVSFPTGNTAPSLTGTLTRTDGTAIDVTAATGVDFVMRLLADRRMKVDAAANVDDASGGLVSYDWAPGDLDTPGDYETRWRIRWADGTIEATEPANTLTVTSI